MRFIGVIALLSLSLSAHAGIEQAITQCAKVENSNERLVCYDKIASKVANHKAAKSPSVAHNKPSSSTPKIVESSVTATSTVTEPTNVVPVAEQVEDFGIQYKAPENEVEKIYLEISKVKKNARGMLTFYFTNGQVWKQAEPSRYKAKKGNKVYIEKAALGSFILGSDDRNAKIRVKRLK